VAITSPFFYLGPFSVGERSLPLSSRCPRFLHLSMCCDGTTDVVGVSNPAFICRRGDPTVTIASWPREYFRLHPDILVRPIPMTVWSWHAVATV